MSELIRIRHLSYRYPDGTTALRDVSFVMGDDERVALLGANGSGKTTLLLHLNGLLQSKTGEVELDGMPVEASNLKQIRQRVGFLFQNPDDQLFLPTVAENIAFGISKRDNGRDERVRTLLEQVGLAGLEGRNAWHLSIGEKRRASLASVLAMKVRLLVLDEPTAGLDPRGQREFGGMLDTMRLPMVIASHNLEFVRRLCTRVVVLEHGSVAADGPTETILNDKPLLLQHGLA
ncbi:energy-coupling factor ABC transporter ATP-binding protein [bacterium]|nr:energy-coupling factor ABC transporter ATP-binding protein [bacterium]